MAVVHLTSSTFEAEVLNSNIPVIVDFWAEWCGPCKMLGPIFEQLSSDYTDKLKFAKLNVEDGQDLAASHDVQGIPCLILFKDREEADRIVGFMPKDALKKKIDEIMSK